MRATNEGHAPRTFRGVMEQYAHALSTSIRASDAAASRAMEVFERLSRPWARMTVGDAPPWPNDICDDGSPFELSAAFNGGRTELRMLVEAQEPPFELASNWAAGLAVNRELAEAEGASLTRFDRIAPLFAPAQDENPMFALWHAAVLAASGEALFKAYLNPRIHGAERAPGLVREALLELGLEDAASLVDRYVGADGDALRYFSLDLADTERARVKVYVARSSSALAVERLLCASRNFEPGLASALLFALTGDLGPFSERPILVCLAFDGEEAPVATLHVPVRCYCSNDEHAVSRISAHMDAEEAALLRNAASSIARQPLSESRGVVTYASFRPGPRGLRTTAYLAPMLYRRGEEMNMRNSSAPSASL